MVCWFLLAGLVCPAQAQTDAYSIQVAVVDRSPGEQQNAYLVAMRSVLLANSGDKTLLNRDDVRAGLQQADSYVESFRYTSPEPGTVISRDTPLTDAVRQSGQATQLMQIQFNRQLINDLIRPPKQAATSDENPEYDPFANVQSALLWVIIEDGGKETLVSGAAGQNIVSRAREIAGAAGMTLWFPAGDNNDLSALSIADITAGNIDVVTQAASRYAQPLTLAAHVMRKRSGSWEGSWLKVAAGQQATERFTSRSLDDALQLGIGWLNPSAASNTTQSSGSGSTYQGAAAPNLSGVEGLVWVSPLRSTKHYADVMDFLTSIDSVTVAYPKEVLSGGVVFAVQPRNALPSVASAASTRDWLRQAPTPSSASESLFAQGISLSLEFLR